MKSLKIVCAILWLPLCALGQDVQDAENVKDVYEIKFNANATQYRAALVLLQDSSCAMRVRFNDAGTKIIGQSVAVEHTPSGIKIKGYDPVYAGTSIKFPSYNVTEFYLSEDDKGNYTSIKNIDKDEKITQATIQKIEGEIEVSHFLFFFNWKLE